MCSRCMPELQRRWEGKFGGKDVRNKQAAECILMDQEDHQTLY